MGGNDLIIDVVVLGFTSRRCLLGGCIRIWGFISFRERVEVELNVRCSLSLRWTYHSLLDLVLAQQFVVKARWEDGTSSDRFLNLLVCFNGEKGWFSNSVLIHSPSSQARMFSNRTSAMKSAPSQGLFSVRSEPSKVVLYLIYVSATTVLMTTGL